MRLINLRTLKLEELNDNSLPPYAILSHTWEREEVTYKDWGAQTSTSHLKGYEKILGFAQAARSDHGCSYGWVDTCCIDKSSSAELTEAINSMFAYYKNADVCLAYLADVKRVKDTRTRAGYICLSRWMTRGWTLQELLAPSRVVFYDADWEHLGSLLGLLADRLESFTGIPRSVLLKDSTPADWSVAQRMSWASRRHTTRVEDKAYCLLGLFDVNLPLIYGEGEKAFTRLQEEIIRSGTDHSIFAWHFDSRLSRRSSEPESNPVQLVEEDSDLTPPIRKPAIPLQASGGSDSSRMLLAPSPAFFWDCKNVVECYLDVKGWIESYEMTNLGLSISLPLVPCSSQLGMYHAVLNCSFKDQRRGPIAINLQRTSQTSTRQQNANNVDLATMTFGVVRTHETESSRFQCSAEHFDRLAIVEEEDLITHRKTRLSILRLCSPSLVRGPQNEVKKPRMASMRVSRGLTLFQPGRLKVVLKEDFESRLERKAALPQDQWDPISNIWFTNGRVGVLSFSNKSVCLTFVWVTGVERDSPFHLGFFETSGSIPMDETKLLSCEYESTTVEGIRIWPAQDETRHWAAKRRPDQDLFSDDPLRPSVVGEQELSDQTTTPWPKEEVLKVDPLRLGQLTIYDLRYALVEIQIERSENMSKIFHRASVTITNYEGTGQDATQKSAAEMKLLK